MMKTISEEEEIEKENSGIQEWTEEDNNKIGNMYHKRPLTDL